MHIGCMEFGRCGMFAFETAFVDSFWLTQIAVYG